MKNVMSDRVKTLEQKVEVLEELVEHYQTKLEHTEERVRYMIAMLEQRTDSGVQVFGA
jgi:chaperonin cofactor prefoldin